MMQTVDFPRSSLTFRIDRAKQEAKTASRPAPYTLNNARIPLDCTCVITEKGSGVKHEFVLGGNCKTEIVGAEDDLFTEPNGDFVPVASQTEWMVLKAYDRVNKGVMLYPPELGPQPERQIIPVQEAFDSLRIDVEQGEGAVLESDREIVEAVLADRLLNGITELESDRYTAVIEYPIKTMNANERDWVWQPDTGPVLFPDLSREPEDLIGGFELAFVAYNKSSWAEFVLRVPTPLSEEISVYHYSKRVRVDCANRMIDLG